MLLQVDCHLPEEEREATYALLASLLQKGSVVCQIGMSKVLAHLCQHPQQPGDHQVKGIEACIASLVRLLVSSNQSLLQQILAAVLQIVPQYRHLLRRADAVPGLIRLLREGTSVCQLGAASALTSMSELVDTRADISAALEDSIPLLVNLMKHAAPALQLSACSLLASIFIDSSAAAQRFAEGAGVEAAAVMLTHHSMLARQAAMQGLANAAASYPDIQASIVEQLLPAITDALYDNHAGVQSSAACIIRTLTLTQSTRLCRAGMHKKLLAILATASMDTQKHAVDALCSLMSHQPRIKDSIIAAGGPEILIRLLGSTGTLKAAGAIALSMLAIDSPQRKGAIIQAGGIPAFAQLLEDVPDFVRQQGACGLQALASGDALCQRKIIDSGCIPMLVERLQGGAAAAAAAALTALSEGSKDTKEAIVKDGALTALAQLLESNLVPEQSAALQALCSLLHDQPYNCKAASELGVIPALTALVTSSNALIQKQAAQTWQALAASHPVIQQAICEAGGFQGLGQAISDIRDRGSPCRKGAAMIRSICCSSRDGAEAWTALLQPLVPAPPAFEQVLSLPCLTTGAQRTFGNFETALRIGRQAKACT